MEGAAVKTVPLTPELIDSYMDYLQAKGRAQGTIDSYQRKLKRLYGDLPEAGKAVGRDTLGLWRGKLARDGYSAAAINQFVIAANGYLEYMGAREFQVTDKLEVSDEFQPELTRGEYLRLLSAARLLGRERTYLLVKVFGNSDLPVQELEHLTVEAAQRGTLSVRYNCSTEVIRFPQRRLPGAAGLRGAGRNPLRPHLPHPGREAHRPQQCDRGGGLPSLFDVALKRCKSPRRVAVTVGKALLRVSRSTPDGFEDSHHY